MIFIVNGLVSQTAPDTNEANTQQQQPQQQQQQQQQVANPNSEPPTPNNTQAAAPQVKIADCIIAEF